MICSRDLHHFWYASCFCCDARRVWSRPTHKMVIHESPGSGTMGDRMDEMKGNVKEGVGKLTGNERLEAEGDAQADAAKARRETKGAMRQAGGKVKEAVGDLTGNER